MITKFLMKIIMVVGLMIPAVTTADADTTGIIRGVVLDASTKEPLYSAEVAIYEINIGTRVTSLDGSYAIKGVPAGRHIITASLIAYNISSDTILINPGRETVVNFELRAEAIKAVPVIVDDPPYGIVKSCDFVAPQIEFPVDRKIFFEVYHINRAWGFRFEGYYIDSDGYIYTYSVNHDNDSISPGQEYSEKDLMSRFPESRKLFAKIETSTLREKASLLGWVFENDTSKSVEVCRDAGESAFWGYRYFDATPPFYKPILLYQAGDIARRNESGCALKLARWLNSIIYGSSEITCGYPE